MVKLRASGEGAQGSFGIPEDLEQKVQAKKVEEPVKEEEETKVENSEAKEIFKVLGIEFTQEDFQRVLFKGYVEKDVVIVKGYLTATFKTLTGREWDEIDELLADETKNIPMTMNGMDIRKSILSLSYGVVKLQGNYLAKDISDTKAAAQARRKQLLDLAPAVSNLMIEKHAAFTHAINLVTRDPGTYLKNS